MKYSASKEVLVLSALAVFCCSKKNHPFGASHKDSITLMVTKTSDYCGGIDPGEETLTQLKTPSRLTNNELYFVEIGQPLNTSILLETDENGNASSRELKMSTYQIFSKPKWLFINKHRSRLNYPTSCTEWIEVGEAQLEIVEGQAEYKINIHSTCNPCESPSR
ncbi:MAG: hypothetical protein AAF519_01765 [Bacteroidota bacterium]